MWYSNENLIKRSKSFKSRTNKGPYIEQTPYIRLREDKIPNFRFEFNRNFAFLTKKESKFISECTPQLDTSPVEAAIT